MARPSKYSPEFKTDAVALWRACGGKRTVRDVAADLNVNTETLRSWIYAAERAAVVAGHSPEPASPQAELVRLRAAIAARGGSVHGVIFHWLAFYNARRRHSALSYLSPLEFEQQHHKAAKPPLAA